MEWSDGGTGLSADLDFTAVIVKHRVLGTCENLQPNSLSVRGRFNLTLGWRGDPGEDDPPPLMESSDENRSVY